MTKYIGGIPRLKPKTRESMIEYLKNHFRYSTMNSWNGSYSYAHRVKFGHLDLTTDQVNACYDMLDVASAWDEVHDIKWQFAHRHKHGWQLGFNGRSSGYIVLYMGGVHEDGRVFCWPGKSVDQGEDFSTWETEDLEARVNLIFDFDQTCERMVAAFVEYATENTATEETVLVPQKVRVAKPKGESK